MNYIHHQKICHRDIKVENIIVNKAKNSIKLIDFGLASQFDKGDKNKVLGTLLYMAPEVLLKKPYTA